MASFVPKDCAEIYKSGKTANGVYTIQPQNSEAFGVYCDQKTDGGGWTVFQKRLDGSQDFYLGWEYYENGFGSLDGEFWLGLQKIHRLANQSRNVLRVDLEDFSGASAFTVYNSFAVEDKNANYKLDLGVYSGTAGDSLSKGNGMAFSTKDQDNDISSGNCAVEHRAAWWYKACHDSNLNGKYLHGSYTGRLGNSYAHGCCWKTWKGYYYSMKSAATKMRPINF
ncbi:fibrinogen C domain-containing protein 1-like [Montipora foliosa]|uniref:fibrinogen C domain-containing protein 1-like n=1 Tax=Montipora foliosa TaxID=591990 RepID=UPI0035F15511